MKKELTLLSTPLIMLAAAGSANAGMSFCLTPYAGVDAQVRHMSFQKKFGGNVLKKNYPEGNFFAGLKFNDYIGIEAGYEVSKKKSRANPLNNTDIVLGAGLINDPLVTYKNSASTKIHGWNLNLSGYLPIFCEDNSLNLIGSVGLAQLKLRIRERLTLTIQEPGETPVSFERNVHLLKHNKHKAVLRLAGGAQYMITDCVGVRGLVTFENTSKLKTPGISSTHSALIAKPKNTFIYGLGIFTSF